MALIKIDGSELPLDDAIASDDAMLKQALTPYYPGVANSDIKRTTENGQMIVTVVKRAGSKGGYVPIIESLRSAPPHVNPAVKLAAEIQREEEAGGNDPLRIIERSAEIERAIAASEAEEQEVFRMLKVLKSAGPVSSHSVPAGF
jgi:hypothetical protein